jgi:hypothetical protein
MFVDRCTETFYFEDGTTHTCNAGTYRGLGKLYHRLDGPAYIHYWIEDDGTGEIITYAYYVYGHFLGKNLSEKDFEERKNKKMKELVFA